MLRIKAAKPPAVFFGVIFGQSPLVAVDNAYVFAALIWVRGIRWAGGEEVLDDRYNPHNRCKHKEDERADEYCGDSKYCKGYHENNQSEHYSEFSHPRWLGVDTFVDGAELGVIFYINSPHG